MSKLTYKIEDRVIAKVLGIQNFTTDEAAVLELVKNAYDAGATKVDLSFSKSSLVVKDNGKGMSLEDIKNLWMHVGKSDKGYSEVDQNNENRILSGSKGIGRFALARLGSCVKLYSKKKSFETVKWETNWNESYVEIEENMTDRSNGTEIHIYDLRSVWGKRRLEQLKEFLERTYNDSKMSIRIISENYNVTLSNYFPKPEVGINCKSYIHLDIKSGELFVNVKSDEFNDYAQKILPDINIKNFEFKQNINILLSNWDNDGRDSIDERDINKLIDELGDFSAEFFFNFKASKNDKAKYEYKYTVTDTVLSKGVVLYRNAFSLSSYDGNKDWLNLNARARKSPAAATHDTGAWRVRENQIAGFVCIDKEENPLLQDLSNRQGLDENIYYHLLVEVISLGLKEFERYRQSIIRAIKKHKESEQGVLSKSDNIITKLLSKRCRVQELSDIEEKQLLSEIKDLKQSLRAMIGTEREAQARYEYDVRLLNVLATIGMKVATSAHEIYNDRNHYILSYDNIENALKAYDMWDILQTPEYTRISTKNIPKIIEKGRSSMKRIVRIIDTVLQKSEVQRFIPKSVDLKGLIEDIVRQWKADYNRVNFNLDIQNGIVLNLSDDVLWTIFDNLILNSIQQNSGNVLITIEVSVRDNTIQFNYHDNGKGLAKKYLVRPRLILEPHESTRNGGHGLGMWIVYNTILSLRGEIDSIDGYNGFNIIFHIKEMSSIGN
ncbi:sensor histidine kinase [Veillonella sp.]|jgi:histidine kinase|uniref:sensor histidine kinase n=2 Tax=Veillonella TaxID=29465 RepID=UPI002912D49E|nr:sensor histidine kinase [Veillonella sp.]MDU5495545.1 sensor histidine kinase [Veillonella sp.]